MMKHTKGTYVKAEGAEWGAYWNGKRWIRFQCVGCEYARKNLTNRISTSQTRVKLGHWENNHRHDIMLHNQWLRDGKPVK